MEGYAVESDVELAEQGANMRKISCRPWNP